MQHSRDTHTGTQLNYGSHTILWYINLLYNN